MMAQLCTRELTGCDGREYLKEFWRTWSFLAERLEQLREGGK